MRKKIYLTIAIIGIALVGFGQNVPSYVPSNGLVGYWPLEGNANDVSGNGNQGTVIGATLTTDRKSNTNSAYNFDGNSDYIDCGYSSLFDITQSITISAWVYSNNLNGDHGIISKMNTSNTTYDLITSSSKIRWLEGGGFLFSSDINTGQWYHVVAVFDIVKQTKSIFINGVLSTSMNVNLSSIPKNSDHLYIGAHQPSNVSTWSWNGKLDEIGLWNRVLTQQEILSLYNELPPCTNPSALITPQSETTFCQGGFVNLNANSGPNYSYQWYNNGQLINNATSSVYQASNNGNYTVKVIDSYCYTISSPTIVNVNPYPSNSVISSGNTTFCSGGSVTLTAQGTGSYLWSNGQTTKSITTSLPGVYSVSITQNNCTSNSSQTILTINLSSIKKV